MTLRSGASDHVSIVALLNGVLRHRRMLVGMALLTAAVVVAVTLLLPATYTVSAKFVPEVGQGATSRLAGIAADLGFAIPSTSPVQSPDFFAVVLKSHQILSQTVDTAYRFSKSSGWPWRTDTATVQGDLLQIFDVAGASRAIRAERAIRELQKRMDVTTDPSTGIVTLSVTTHWPELSQEVVTTMLGLLNNFNVHVLQSQAASERVFVEGRLNSARAELMQYEDRMRTFLQRNRNYRGSPTLALEYDRLQREVQLRQDLVTQLAESYEKARIEEVRNTPVITVVEPPMLPPLGDRRHVVAKGVLGFVLGGVLGMFIATLKTAATRAKAIYPEDSAEFEALVHALISGLYPPLLRRRLAGGSKGSEPPNSET